MVVQWSAGYNVIRNFSVQTRLEDNMQDFSKAGVLSLSAKICDRCGRRSELDDPEFHEFLTIDQVVGFGSVFGDGERIKLDLCQYCMEGLLGSSARIKSDRPAEKTLRGLCVINVTPDVNQHFVEQLDNSPQTNEALKRTMQSQSPWEN